MAFIPYKGTFKTIQVPVKVSTAISKYAIVSVLTSGDAGTVGPATSSTTNLSHIGVSAKAIASTDADYATARKIPVIVPTQKNCEWLSDVTATLVAADVGLEVDLTDSLTLNRGASSVDVAMVRDFISTTKCTAVLKLCGSY